VRAEEITATTSDAKRLLTGSGADARRGVAMLIEASDAGGGEATEMLAIIAAAGLGREPDWNAALDLLARSAERGWAPAQAQLRLLTGVLQGEAHWRSLRDRIDVAALIATPPRRPLCEAPRIRTSEGFASPAFCDWVIARAKGRTKRAEVFDHATGAGHLHGGRTNSELEIRLIDMDFVLLVLRARISALTNFPVAAFEPPKVLRYTPGQEYRHHVDFLEPGDPVMAQSIAREGQRIATFLVYLNDDYEGGETEFSQVGLRFRGHTGDALYFANVNAAGAPDRMTLHAGLTTTRGEKWVLSQWIRDRAFLS
jgi:hypothetical protein